jgi:hypothetical protein
MKDVSIWIIGKRNWRKKRNNMKKLIGKGVKMFWWGYL